jgi:hypothetical protein
MTDVFSSFSSRGCGAVDRVLARDFWQAGGLGTAAVPGATPTRPLVFSLTHHRRT